MSKIFELESYEPLSGRKNTFLGFSQNPKKIQNLTLHGVFDSYNYSQLTTAFILVFVLELYTIYMLWSHVPNKLTLIIPFALDFLLAYGFTYFTAKPLLKTQNLLELTKHLKIEFHSGQNYTFTQEKYESEVFRLKLLKYLGHVILFAIAAYKIYITYIYFDGTRVSLFFLIAVMIGIAVLHAAYTGFFGYEWFIRLRLEGELKRYNQLDENSKITSAVHVTKHREFQIDKLDLQSLFNIEELNEYNKFDSKDYITTKASLTKVGENYQLKTWGLFQDKDLSDLIESQKNDTSKKAVAAFGLKHQLDDILNNDATR